MLEEAFTPATLNDGTTCGSGFGWRIRDSDGHRLISHGGAWVGFRAFIGRYPTQRLTIVLLSNRGDFNGPEFYPSITRLYLPPAED